MPTATATRTRMKTFAVDCYKRDGEDDQGYELWRVGGWVIVRAADFGEARRLAAAICPYRAVDMDVVEWTNPVSAEKLGKFIYTSRA